MRRVVLALAASAAAGGTTVMGGCHSSAAAAGAGAGVANSTGTSKASLDASPSGVVAAAKASLAEMGVALVSDRASDMDGEVVGRIEGDARVAIYVERLSDSASRVIVRVGISGDEARQALIIQKIKERL